MATTLGKRAYSSSSSPPNNDEVIRIVMVGKTGAGKSATGNTILGRESFKSKFTPESLTEWCEKADGEVGGQKVAVIDTPGLFYTHDTEEETRRDIFQCITHASPGPHIFLIIIKLGRYTQIKKMIMPKIQQIFGEEAYKYSMVLFTHGDLLKGKPIEELLKESEDLQKLVAKCNGQYHVFNNKVKDRSQVTELFEKIKKINEQNGGSYYTTEMFQKAESVIEEKKQRILKEKEEQNHKEQKNEEQEIKEKYQQQMSEVSSPPTVFDNNELIRIVMVGKTGVGKSASGNTILGKQCFKSEFSLKSLTQHCEKDFGEVGGQKVAVIDTPGLFYTHDTEDKTVKDIAQCITYASPGPHIFLIIIKLDKFKKEEKQTVEKIQKIFGEKAYKYSMVLFTHGDLLDGKPIEEFLKESKDLQELVAKCNGQYHVFNNEMEDHSQVSELLGKIKKINVQNGGRYYTTEIFEKAERVIEEEKQRILKEKEKEINKEREGVMKEIEEKYEQILKEYCPITSTTTASNNDESIRIVMVGKTGAGKSATGNTILGKKCFESEFSLKSLTTVCKKDDHEVDGKKVAVIDTPGLFDNRCTEEKTLQDIAKCISYASPGPNIFLIIIKLGRFTEEENQTVQKIQKIFGEEAYKYSMVLFTHGDLLKGKSIEKFLEDSKDLKELVDKCKGQCHVFNNEEGEDHTQVEKLLENIRKINEDNGGSYYTTEMFQKVERVIEEEKQRILKEKEKEINKEREGVMKEIEEKYEQILKEYCPITSTTTASNNVLKVEEEQHRKKQKKEEQEIQEKYQQKVTEVEGDREIVDKLKEECKKEIANRMKQLEEKIEREARKKAEESDLVNKVLINVSLAPSPCMAQPQKKTIQADEHQNK